MNSTNITRGDLINWTVFVGLGLYIYIVILVSYRLIKKEATKHHIQNIALLITAIICINAIDSVNIFRPIIMLFTFVIVIIYASILIIKNLKKRPD